MQVRVSIMQRLPSFFVPVDVFLSYGVSATPFSIFCLSSLLLSLLTHNRHPISSHSTPHAQLPACRLQPGSPRGGGNDGPS